MEKDIISSHRFVSTEAVRAAQARIDAASGSIDG